MRIRSLSSSILLVVLALGCSGDAGEPPSSSEVVPSASATYGLDDVPVEARVSDGGGMPRPPAYWAVWNTCAEENRAAVAAANGGAEAGWVLVDDVLASPGLQLGDYRLETCRDALVVLERSTSSDPSLVDALAAELIAADLNRNVGAESCPAADEAAIGSHAILASLGYEGSRSRLDVMPDTQSATSTFRELLAAYNSGVLCR